MKASVVYTLDFDQITLKDLPRVGGKNAALGELFNALQPHGVSALDGFATTADAYRVFLAAQAEAELSPTPPLWSTTSVTNLGLTVP
jgi:phosphoenolpyruvate synthase/pyruvate phosphate dikinase